MIMARSFPADPEIVWGGLLPAGPQEKVTALNNFQTSRKLARDR
jgi:hypothetical protein